MLSLQLWVRGPVVLHLPACGHRSASALRRQDKTGNEVPVGSHLPQVACALSADVPKKVDALKCDAYYFSGQ